MFGFGKLWINVHLDYKLLPAIKQRLFDQADQHRQNVFVTVQFIKLYTSTFEKIEHCHPAVLSLKHTIILTVLREHVLLVLIQKLNVNFSLYWSAHYPANIENYISSLTIEKKQHLFTNVLTY